MMHTSRSLTDRALLEILALSTDATAIYTTENIIIEMANDAMIAFWGKDRSVIGMPLEQAVPELQGQEFIDILQNVWRTGITYQASERPAQLNVSGIIETFYFDFIYRALCHEDGSTYCILHSATDVTARVLHQQAVRESEARQAFLLRLSDTLRPLVNAALIQTEAARIMGEYLGVSRVGYGEVTQQRWFKTEHNWTDGSVPAHHGTHDLEAFGPDVIAALRQGTNLVIDDMLTDKRTDDALLQQAFNHLQIRSVVTVSLIKSGRIVAAFYVQYSKPRNWQLQEILLIQEVAERTWSAVERAHAEQALLASKVRQEFLLALNDKLRHLTNPQVIQYEAASILGEYLQADRVGFAEVHKESGILTVTRNYTNGVAGIEGNYQSDDYGLDLLSELVAGQTVVRSDVANHPDLTDAQKKAYQLLHVGSIVIVPLVKGGQLMMVLFVHLVRAYNWTADDLSLIHETSERTWNAIMSAQAEADLRSSEERYRTLFNSIDEAFMLIEFVFDEQGQPVDYYILDTNPAFEQQTGLKFQPGKTIRQIMPDLEDTWIQTYGQVALSGKSIRFEEYNQGTGGWYSVFASAVGNETRQVVVVFTDITERKKDEERKNDFITMASHELKTPLTSVKAYIQMLGAKARQKEDGFTIDALGKVESQVNKMQSLIRGFLDVARLEAGKIHLNRQDFLVNELLNDVIDEIKLTMKSHHVSFEPCKPVSLHADKDKIGQVVHNFLSNAIKYSPKGKHISVKCDVKEKQVEVSVTDEGMGIKPQDIDKLFERFYRVESKYTQTIAGFGIGLYLCAEIIEQHNGKIGVNSQAGMGSTFWFTLPLS